MLACTLVLDQGFLVSLCWTAACLLYAAGLVLICKLVPDWCLSEE